WSGWPREHVVSMILDKRGEEKREIGNLNSCYLSFNWTRACGDSHSSEEIHFADCTASSWRAISTKAEAIRGRLLSLRYTNACSRLKLSPSSLRSFTSFRCTFLAAKLRQIKETPKFARTNRLIMTTLVSSMVMFSSSRNGRRYFSISFLMDPVLGRMMGW